jgi:hypothetical protein
MMAAPSTLSAPWQPVVRTGGSSARAAVVRTGGSSARAAVVRTGGSSARGFLDFAQYSSVKQIC